MGLQLVISTTEIEKIIITMRGKRVIVANDLAMLYGVSTKRLNEQVKRNNKRFPTDFMFQLTAREKEEVVAICDHLYRLKFSKVLPYVFTEQGVAMISGVLHSDRAIEVNIQIMRAFIKLKNTVFSYDDLKRRIETIEKKYESQDDKLNAILNLLATPMDAEELTAGFGPIGFLREKEE